jgi:hypothetical protein
MQEALSLIPLLQNKQKNPHIHKRINYFIHTHIHTCDAKKRHPPSIPVQSLLSLFLKQLPVILSDRVEKKP